MKMLGQLSCLSQFRMEPFLLERPELSHSPPPMAQPKVEALMLCAGTFLKCFSAAPSDYTSVFSRPLTFSSTQPTDSVTINIIDNTIVETNLEQFTARLSVNNALNPGVTLAPSTASVTIDDDDGRKKT